uniref:Geranylgeranyl transferase type-2 subunit beta n=1 Tax=Lepeophtheirus salmonis TaxID=72036 RepID=D3PGC8_LEPSM|nr:Geranylgeranyl transferase type-2 subunit beta [Lepeophtheirus salmonis]
MGVSTHDAKIPENAPTSLLTDLHRQFVAGYSTKDNYEYAMSEFLRIDGIYWSVTLMDLIDAKEDLGDPQEVFSYIKECFDPTSGGYRPAANHDSHILYTLSAIQIAAIYDSMDIIPKAQVTKFISEPQQADGSFWGDKWAEKDSRFSFCAVAALKLLHPESPLSEFIHVDKAFEYVISCMNFDGGFGTRPGSESHAGNTYCCTGFLSLTDNLHRIDADILGRWLAERQLPSGGVNGRPQKLPDVCYSWWVLASLSIIGRLHWIDKKALSNFIYACQDSETGGISDRPGDYPDPFHTLFGMAGLSLMGVNRNIIKEVNPVFCMPQSVIDKCGISIKTIV